MAIKEEWKDIGNTLGNDKANHHIYIGYRTRNVRNALSFKITFFYSTAIAKSFRSSNPIYRFVAFN